MKNKNSTRKAFIKKLVGGSLASAFTPAVLLAAENKPSMHVIPYQQTFTPNDMIQVALIGSGIQGIYDAGVALKVPGVKLVAVADLFDDRLIRAKELFGKDIFTTRNYRDILQRKDVDAVILAVPDHLHMQIGTAVLRSRKALYCEKPVVQKIEQGWEMINTEQETGQVLQVGSQRVSSIVYAKARDLVKSGAIGTLNLVEAYYDRHSAQSAWQYSIPPGVSEKTVDWEAFLSDQAPKIPFDPVRFFRWRNYREYGTGVAGDLFVHLFSGIHFILGSNGPTRVMSSGGLRYWKDGRNVPDIMVGIYDYPATGAHPAFTLTLRVNFADGSGGGQQFRFIGNEGQMVLAGNTLTIKRQKMPKEPGYTIDSFSEATQAAFLKEYRAKYPPVFEVIGPQEETYSAPKGYDHNYDHFANFFQAVRDKTKVVEDARFGVRAAAPALLSNISYFESRIVDWDPEAIRFI